jgi:polyhydroxybutyrate depolymerase
MFISVLTTLVVWAPAVYADGEHGQLEKTIEHGGEERAYILYKPENLAANAPLLFVLHGRGQTGLGFSELGFNDLADKNGFVVAYPQATDAYWGDKDDPKAIKYSEWNSENKPDRADDVDFLSTLAKTLQSEHGLNPERTFVSGFSKGGFMSYSLACLASDTFKGVAIVASLMDDKVYASHNPPPTAMPVLHIHGTKDSLCPIGGDLNKSTGERVPPDVAAIIDLWAKSNNCTTSETKKITDTTTATFHKGGVNGNEVHYYEISGGEHLWPGEVQKEDMKKKQGYDDVSGINATEIIWDFFSKY